MASPAARHGESSRRKFTSYHSHAHVKPGYKLRGYDHAKDRTAGLAAKPNENRVPGGHPAAPSCGGLIIRLRLVGGSKLSNGMDLLLWNIVSNGNRVSGKRLAVDIGVGLFPCDLPADDTAAGLAVALVVALAVGACRGHDRGAGCGISRQEPTEIFSGTTVARVEAAP